MLRSKVVGGILLIVGTSIGGGMLALPVATAEVGFVHSILFLCLCWLVMTSGALLLLEVNLRLPAGSNMISMARINLGIPGQVIAWITYLMLLYTLLAAYISGGSDVFHGLFQWFHLDIPPPLTALLFTVVFSSIVYSGMRTVDYVNRGLMVGKLSIYCILLLIISPHSNLHTLHGGHLAAITQCLMILVASFSFASIVPSLRDYFQDDIKSLYRIILIGSFIPLICYIAWDGVIMSVVKRDGPNGLMALSTSDHATSGLTLALNSATQSAWISGFFGLFTSICMVTAFLGVSIGLFDFLADGLSLKKNGISGKFVLTLTFLPPLVVVLFSPGIYLQALNYAGICCIVLLLLLPVVMAWKMRRLAADTPYLRLIPGGNTVLGILLLIGLALLFYNFAN